MTALRDAFLAQAPDAAQCERFAVFAAQGLPEPRAEAWRWTDLHGAIGKTFGEQKPRDTTGARVTLTGDFVAETEMDLQTSDPMALLAGGLAPAGLRKAYIIDGTTDAPVHLGVENQNSLAGSQVHIRITSGNHAILMEKNQTARTGFSVDFRKFTIEPGAHLTRILVQANAPQQSRINQAFVEVGEGGSYSEIKLDFGARLSRNETKVRSTGPNTSVLLNAAYALDGDERADNTTLVRHDFAGCVTRQLVKGVVTGQARAVFQGKFHVARSGQHTDAKMGHHTLLLSDAAKVQAKPELEIYADDVACAHGNTTGRLDDEALFYMRQRGLSLETAKAFLIRAFAGEVFQPLDNEATQEQLAEQINVWMEQHL